SGGGGGRAADPGGDPKEARLPVVPPADLLALATAKSRGPPVRLQDHGSRHRRAARHQPKSFALEPVSKPPAWAAGTACGRTDPTSGRSSGGASRAWRWRTG